MLEQQLPDIACRFRRREPDLVAGSVGASFDGDPAVLQQIIVVKALRSCWIVGRISTLTGVAPGEIDARDPLLRYGLASVAVVSLVADLEAWLDYRFRENPDL